MTQPWTSEDTGAMAEVQKKLGERPGIALALLRLLEEAGNDPTRIDEISRAGVSALKKARDSLPVPANLPSEPALKHRKLHRHHKEEND